MPTHAIQVIDIVKRFGNFTAVDGVSFAVEEGEIFGLLGPNGAGKSTLIRMMTTLLDITSGTAIIEGADVRKNPNTARRSMGVIPQAMTSDGDLTVWENLSIYSKLYGIPAGDREKSIDELLNWLISPSGVTLRPAIFPAACVEGWKSRVAWCIARESFSLTSPRPALILSPAWPFGK